MSCQLLRKPFSLACLFSSEASHIHSITGQCFQYIALVISFIRQQPGQFFSQRVNNFADKNHPLPERQNAGIKVISQESHNALDPTTFEPVGKIICQVTDIRRQFISQLPGNFCDRRRENSAEIIDSLITRNRPISPLFSHKVVAPLFVHQVAVAPARLLDKHQQFARFPAKKRIQCEGGF